MSLAGKVIVSPEGKAISIAEMEDIFDKAGASLETVFRRREFNEVISYTKGAGIDIGCGLNKIHSGAIGIDSRLGDKDFGYPFGANIKCLWNKEFLSLFWFADESLDFVFSSHCLEHFARPQEALKEMTRVLRPEGYLIVVLPDMRYYPRKGKPGANPDHEWDCYPETLVDMAKGVSQLELVQLDTLHNKLKDVTLSARDRRIADHYGHKSLNFSFEAVLRKI